MHHFKIRNLLLEPYRLFFGVGVVYALVVMALWSIWMIAPGRIALPWTMSPTAIHGHVMVYGVIGAYAFGFLLTAFPRWVGQPFASHGVLISLCLSLFIGQSCLLIGATGHPLWLGAAALFENIAYLGLWLVLSRMYKYSPLSETQPRYVLLAVAAAVIGVALFYGTFLFPESRPLMQELSVTLGVYGYLLFLVIAITYRIVPFFAGRVIANYTPTRGRHTLKLAALFILMRIAGVAVASRFPALYYVVWISDLALLAVLLKEWRGWFSKSMSKTPILFILFLGFFWIAVFLAFSGLEFLLHLIEPTAPLYPMYRTLALHALLVGAFSTLIIGISTRVVRGHGGLPIKADAWMLISMLLIQIASVMRVFLPLLTSVVPSLAAHFYWAGPMWTLAFAIWAVRYLPILGRAPAGQIS